MIKAKVAQVNSGKWQFDEPIVMVNLRKQKRRHYEKVRDGFGGFRRKIQPSFKRTEVFFWFWLGISELFVGLYKNLKIYREH